MLFMNIRVEHGQPLWVTEEKKNARKIASTLCSDVGAHENGYDANFQVEIRSFATWRRLMDVSSAIGKTISSFIVIITWPLRRTFI